MPDLLWAQCSSVCPYGVANFQRSDAVRNGACHGAIRHCKRNRHARYGHRLWQRAGAGKGRHGRPQYDVSKLPLPASVNDAHSWVLSEAEASLARLRVGTLHGVLLHRSSDLVGPQSAALYAAMRELQEAGKVRKIGLSIYAPAELDVYEDMYTFDLIQAPINLVDRRLASSGWLRRLKERGCEVHAALLFCKACCLCRVAQFLQSLHRGARYGTDGTRGSRTTIWTRFAPHLSYPLSFPEIDRVVVGALDVVQLQEIIQAAEQE